MMILYHGSNVEIKEIDLSKSKRYKDFGRAFYLSSEREQAERLGTSKVTILGGEVVVSSFAFDESAMTSGEMKVKIFNQYDKEWADFVFVNRNKKNKFVHDYDIVYGPIANDNVGNQIFRYKEGYISFDDFLKNLIYKHGITFQYAFCTEAAVKKLIRL